jgi:DNA-binding response OmpR family regulator
LETIEMLDSWQTSFLLYNGVGEMMRVGCHSYQLPLRAEKIERWFLPSEAFQDMDQIVVGDLAIDLERRQVTLQDQEIPLTPTEYRLLCQLAMFPGMILTHRMLLKTVWGEAYNDETEYLHVYIGRLRNKIEVDPANPTRLDTIPRVGYRLRAP